MKFKKKYTVGTLHGHGTITLRKVAIPTVWKNLSKKIYSQKKVCYAINYDEWSNF